MATVDILDELLDIYGEYNDNIFDLESSIKESISILENEMDVHKLSDCHYKEMKWYIEIPYEAKKESIDFNRIKSAIQFNKKINSTEFINIVKCWTASLIEQGYNPLVIVKFVDDGLSKFLNLTKGLTESNQEELADIMKNLSNSMKREICVGALNFFDYYNDFDFDIDDYISLLYSVRPRTEKAKVRLLPPSKDILIFSKVLERHFSKGLSELEYLKWFPIWLWWNLTNLIPMRPSEYCNIERDCLFEKGGLFYIKLPRHKIKLNNKRRIQILSEISIPEKLYRKIEEYKLRTASFGRTDTLISYLSMPNIYEGKLYDSTDGYQMKKLNPYQYTNGIFREDLKSFYEHVVFGVYKIVLSKDESESDKLSITRQLKPGDTRHLAFINLKKQGYHPVEIARLGGHVNLESQNHYIHHVQKYVDLEILELVSNIDLDSYSNKISDSEDKQETSISMSFIEKYVLRPPMTDVKIKLKDGFCTDQFQNCMVEDCWECDFWRISKEELIEKQDILAHKLNDSKSQIYEVIENLKDLYNSIYAYGKDEFYSSNTPDIRKELIYKSKRIDNAIRRYVNLTKVKERIDF